jgi:hypothetical protein
MKKAKPEETLQLDEKDIKDIGTNQFLTIFREHGKEGNMVRECSALEIPGMGCIVKTTEVHYSYPSMATVFLPGTTLTQNEDGDWRLAKTLPTVPQLRPVSTKQGSSAQPVGNKVKGIVKRDMRFASKPE